tara:strand:+ start:1570 stop:2181 length:612 start_codon:yes stop_codon:yes gene_type:complete
MKITNEDNMELMKRYEDNHFDLAIVDPPYRESKDNDMNQWNRKYIDSGRLKDWNNKPNQQYFDELLRVSKNQIIWGANNFNFDFKGFIVWDKNIAFEMKFSMCEIASVSDQLSTIAKMIKIRCQNADKVRIHPTQKPVRLYEFCLDHYAKEGDKILDTHLGSGSLAIACHNLGFDLTACELDKDYFNSAIKRIEQHKAQLRMF